MNRADDQQDLEWLAFIRRLSASSAAHSADCGDVAGAWREHRRRTLAAIAQRRGPGPGDSDAPVRALAADRAGRGGSLADLIREEARYAGCLTDRAMRALVDCENHSAYRLEFLTRHEDWSLWTVRALVSGYRQAGDFVIRLLRGELPLSEARAGLRRYGLAPDARYRALRGRLSGLVDIATLERDLDLVDSTGRRSGLVALVGDEIHGLFTAIPDVSVEGTIGVSRPVTLAGIADEFRLATRAFDAALACGVSGLVRLEDLGLRAAVVADPDMTELLLRRYVEPFGTGEAGGAVLATVERFLANRRRPGPTGLDLFIHANTVRYRLSRFETVTGRSLQDVRTVVEVWWALEARRSASTPDRMRKSLTKLHPKTSVAPQPSA